MQQKRYTKQCVQSELSNATEQCEHLDNLIMHTRPQPVCSTQAHIAAWTSMV